MAFAPRKENRELFPKGLVSCRVETVDAELFFG